MSLRRFEAASTPEALGAVRAALGPEAIILSNRQVNGRVEIIAAGVIDEALLAMASDGPAHDSTTDALADLGSASTAAPSAGPGRVRGVQVSPLAPIEPATDRPAQIRRRSASAKATERAACGPGGAPTAPGGGSRVERAETPVAPPTTAPGRRGERDEAPEPAPAPVPAGDARAEAAPVEPSLGAGGIERVEARLRRLEVGLWGERDEARATLLSKLLALGLGPSLALRIAERAEGVSEDALVRDAFAVLTASVPVRRDTTLSCPGATLVAGPDAQSRTDVLMKFASQQVVAGGPASLLLVSADDGRPGAFEALEAHGRELGAATVRARGVADIGRTIDSFSDRPLVLVDAGPELPELEVPVRAAAAPRRLLVVPATLQRDVVSRAAREARGAGVDACVLSRLDRAARLGETLDALIRESLPIAWWSDSDAAHVPLERASGPVIVATAVAMAKKIGERDDDIALATLVQPRAPRPTASFAGAVNLGGCASPAPLATL